MTWWAGPVARVGKIRSAYSILVGKPKGIRLFGRPECRWKDTIKMKIMNCMEQSLCQSLR